MTTNWTRDESTQLQMCSAKINNDRVQARTLPIAAGENIVIGEWAESSYSCPFLRIKWRITIHLNSSPSWIRYPSLSVFNISELSTDTLWGHQKSEYYFQSKSPNDKIDTVSHPPSPTDHNPWILLLQLKNLTGECSPWLNGDIGPRWKYNPQDSSYPSTPTGITTWRPKYKLRMRKRNQESFPSGKRQPAPLSLTIILTVGQIKTHPRILYL